jgi:hypothetical protein
VPGEAFRKECTVGEPREEQHLFLGDSVGNEPSNQGCNEGFVIDSICSAESNVVPDLIPSVGENGSESSSGSTLGQSSPCGHGRPVKSRAVKHN